MAAMIEHELPANCVAVVVRQHVTDDARRKLGRRVVKHLETQGFEVDEEEQALRKRPPELPHR